MYPFFSALPAILGVLGFVVYQLLKSSGSPETLKIVEKIRAQHPERFATQTKLTSKQLVALLQKDQDFQQQVGQQDFQLLERMLRQQFIKSIVVYVLCAILFIVGVALFVYQSTRPPAAAFDLSIRSTATSPLDCQRLSSAVVQLHVGADMLQAPVDAQCVSRFQGLPTRYRHQPARVELTGTEAFVLTGGAAVTLDAGQLTIALEDATLLPRLRVAILPFQVPDPAAQAGFQEFRDALVDRIFNLSQAFAARGDAFSYMNSIKVVNAGPPMASAADLATFWNESHALQLVRGQIKQTAHPLVVTSVVFIGELAPDPRRAGVQLDLAVTPGAFARAQDSFSLMMLYALARDGQRLQKPNAVVAALLADAYAIGQQVDDPTGELAPIRAAVTGMLQSMGGGGTVP